MKQTSIDAYNIIKNNGLLGRMQWLVYDKVALHGPITQREVIKKFGDKAFGFNGTFTGRFSELEKKGVIRIVGEVVDTFSNRNVNVYEITDVVPKKATKIELLKETIKNLESKLVNYKNKLNELENK